RRCGTQDRRGGEAGRLVGQSALAHPLGERGVYGLGRFLLHPVRNIRQAPDGEVRHVLGGGRDQLTPESGVLFAPDQQRRGPDAWTSHHVLEAAIGPIVVEHRLHRSWRCRIATIVREQLGRKRLTTLG